MKVYTLECEMLAPVSVRQAFEIFEDPRNLARITPPWLNFSIVTPARIEMRKGAEIDYEIRWAGIPLRWKTIITEYEPPFYFVDEQASGPYRYWRHHHSFRPTQNGALVGDRVDYALPFGWLGRIAHTLAVKRQLKQIFEYRQKTLMEMMRGTPLSQG